MSTTRVDTASPLAQRLLADSNAKESIFNGRLAWHTFLVSRWYDAHFRERGGQREVEPLEPRPLRPGSGRHPSAVALRWPARRARLW